MKNKIKQRAKSEALAAPIHLMKKDLDAIRGFSLVESLVSMFILGIVGLGISSMSDLGFKSAASAGLRQDFETLKWTIREQLSCTETLGLPADYNPSVPVPCTGSELTLKKHKGKEFGNPIGSLKWSASCVSDRIQIMITSKKNDPITKKPFGPKDLFEGMADGLCSNYFTGSSCSKPGETVIGTAGTTPVCGKAPVPVDPPEYYVQTVVGSPETGESCAGTHVPSIAECPDGWIAVSCGYRLSKWSNKGTYDSNAPDANSSVGTKRCATTAGGRPGKSGCFKSVATCLNLSKIANGK
jgi:prepilin-type N-terminal cleavage/methylation domain-containing protein